MQSSPLTEDTKSFRVTGQGRFMIRATLLFFTAALFFSCEKDPDLIGMNVTPPQDQLYASVVDSSEITVYSVIEDSIRTDEYYLNLLGSYMDPVFGRSTAGFYAQFRLADVNATFGSSPQLDSIVLSLAYNGYYGDTNILQTVRVYEMAEAIYKDSAYYSNDVVADYGIDYAAHTFYPRPTDSVMVDTALRAPQLRINLANINRGLAGKIMNAPIENLIDNTKFLEYFRGLYVIADPVNYRGSILYFNLTSANTSLTIYYHNSSNDSLSFKLVVDSYSARFNRYDHSDYDQAELQFRKQAVYGDTLLGRDVVYVQSMGGVRAKIVFPNLSKWKDGAKLAVNEAQLVIPCRDTLAMKEYAPPEKMLLLRRTEDGKFEKTEDENEGDTYFGGTYNSKAKEYGFRLTHYVQEMIAGKSTQYGLYLIASGNAIRSNRVLIDGPGNPVRKMKLRIYYSYIK